MKNLKIEILKNREVHAKNKYYIYHSEDRIYFTSKRACSDYIVLLSDTLKDSLNSLNLIQSKLYTLHLDYYVQLPNDFCRKLKYYFDLYIERLSFIFRDFGSGSSLVFVNFKTVMYNLQNSILVFKEFAKKSNNYQLANLLNSNLKMFSLIEQNYYSVLKTSSIDTSYKLVKMPVVHKNTIKMTV